MAPQSSWPRHHPIDGNSGFGSGYLLPVRAASGWPATTYDIVRIGGWALIVFGAVIASFDVARSLGRPD